MAQQARMSRPTGSPCACAARRLPPVIRAAKPKVVRDITTPSTMATRQPIGKPQWTAEARHVADPE